MPQGGDRAAEVPAQGRDWGGLYRSLFLNKRRGRKGPKFTMPPHNVGKPSLSKNALLRSLAAFTN